LLITVVISFQLLIVFFHSFCYSKNGPIVFDDLIAQQKDSQKSKNLLSQQMQKLLEQ